MVFYLYFRGDCFRHEFSRLGELRSVIPENVNVMELTATATVTTRREIIKILDNAEMYVQQTGRAGRDGKLSCALLLYTKSDLSRKRISEPMKQYCTNKLFQCRRTLILKIAIIKSSGVAVVVMYVGKNVYVDNVMTNLFR